MFIYTWLIQGLHTWQESDLQKQYSSFSIFVIYYFNYVHQVTSQHGTFLFKLALCRNVQNMLSVLCTTTVRHRCRKSSKDHLIIGLHWFLPLPTCVSSQMCWFECIPRAFHTVVEYIKAFTLFSKASLIKANEPVTFVKETALGAQIPLHFKGI